MMPTVESRLALAACCLAAAKKADSERPRMLLCEHAEKYLDGIEASPVFTIPRALQRRERRPRGPAAWITAGKSSRLGT